MNLLSVVRNLLVTKEPSPEQKKRLDGHKAFLAADKYVREKNFGQATLDCLDTAIDSGCFLSKHETANIYASRAICLAKLGFDLDAIDDYDEAISLEPEDAHLYFMRSLSKQATGDFNGCISDLEEAIRLSKRHNKFSRIADDYFREVGWHSATEWYESRLEIAQMRIAFYDKNPNLRDDRIKERKLRRKS